jgi:hypothetical protein
MIDDRSKKLVLPFVPVQFEDLSDISRFPDKVVPIIPLFGNSYGKFFLKMLEPSRVSIVIMRSTFYVASSGEFVKPSTFVEK